MSHMVYNSDAFVVIEVVVPVAASEGDPPVASESGLSRGGYEIVDKLARKDIYLEGLLAQCFRDGVTALAQKDSSTEQLDDFISGYAQLSHQPLAVH